MPVGTVLPDSGGYLRRKVSDTGYGPHDWIFIHRELWIEHHGEIPKTHVVSFFDGNKTNVTIENLRLLSKRDNALRNSVHNLPVELVQVIQLKGALKRKLHRHEQRIREQHAR